MGFFSLVNSLKRGSSPQAVLEITGGIQRVAISMQLASASVSDRKGALFFFFFLN